LKLLQEKRFAIFSKLFRSLAAGKTVLNWESAKPGVFRYEMRSLFRLCEQTKGKPRTNGAIAAQQQRLK